MKDNFKLGNDKLFVVRFNYVLPHFQLHIEDDIKKVQEMFSGPKIHIEQVIPSSKLEELIELIEDEKISTNIGERYYVMKKVIQKLIDEAKNG